MVKKLFWIALFDDQPFIEEYDLIRHISRECHLMRNDEYRPSSPGQLLNDIQHFSNKFWIQRGCRLIEQNNFWANSQCACNGNTLLLSSR